MAEQLEIDKTLGFWTLGDFKPEMPLVRGRAALLHRLSVRLQTPRGRFTFRDPKTGVVSGWPNFGTDMAAFLLSKVPPSVVASAAESECLKDEQVKDVEARVEFLNGGKMLHLTLEIFDADGPFKFTLAIEQAKLTLIDLQAA